MTAAKKTAKVHQINTEVRLGRSCRDCSLCCKVYPIKEYQKPAQVMCQHCVLGKGCGIYATRPPSLPLFTCAWLVSEDVGDHWKPLLSHMVLTNDGVGLTVTPDAATVTTV
jgi:hypothetical protein